MKFRVLQDMPFAKVGVIWESHQSENYGEESCSLKFWFSKGELLRLVEDGWLEIVKRNSSVSFL